MPPSVNPNAVTFGAMPLSGDEQTALDSFDHQFSDVLIQSGLYRVSLLQPTHGLLKFFSGNMGIRTVNDFVFSNSKFAECYASSASAVTMPQASDVLTYIEMRTDTDFKYVSSITDLDQVKDRVVARVLFLLRLALEQAARSQPEDVAGDDDPMPRTTKASCEGVWSRKYGEEIQPSSLAQSSVLGKLHRGIHSGVFPLVKVQSIVPSDSFLAQESDEMVLTQHNTWKRKRAGSRVQSIEQFLSLLEILMNSTAFVSISAPAPAATWRGDPTCGLVAGDRVQFSRRGVTVYMKWVRELAARVGDNGLPLLISMEASCRKEWVDPFRGKLQLESCMLQSTRAVMGECLARVAQQRQNLLKPRGGLHEPGGPKRLTYEDVSKKPNFKPGVRTGNKTRDGKQVCKPSQDGRGCRFGGNCKFEHACDVMVGDHICGSTSHTRYDHPSGAGPSGGNGPEV